FFSSRRRHTRFSRDWSSDVCSSDLGGDVVGTLANGGVAIAPYHDLESIVPAELTAEIEQLKADIISGTAVAPVPVEKSKICQITDRKSTRLNSSHVKISYAVFCLKK